MLTKSWSLKNAVSLAVLAVIALAVVAMASAATRVVDRTPVAKRVNLHSSVERPRDSDGDGLSDRYEARRSHTNSRLRDTDGDGLSDRVELQHGSDPLDPASPVTQPTAPEPVPAPEAPPAPAPAPETPPTPEPEVPTPPAPEPPVTEPEEPPVTPEPPVTEPEEPPVTPEPPVTEPEEPPVTPPTPEPPAEEATALRLSPSGVDTNDCSAAKPCKTLNRAYKVAKPGQTVEMASGTYTDTALSLDSAKTSAADVVFRPLAGATVTISPQLHVYAQHLELRELRFTSKLWIESSAADVTIRNSTLKNFDLYSNGKESSHDISFIGGSIGPSANENSRIASNGPSTSASPRDILIDGVDFHDFTVSPGSEAHVECLQVWAVDGLTIRNSKFRNCEVFDIFLQKLPEGAAATPSNILIENNFFDCCGSGYYSIRMGDHAGTSWKDVTIRNNSLNKEIDPDPSVPYSNVKIVGNVGPALKFWSGSTGAIEPKPSGVEVDYNVWYAGAKVGSHDKVAAAGFRNAAAVDFHLNAGAAAIDAGDPANAPATDIDGDARPAGAAPDAGADETGASAPPPPADTTAPNTQIVAGPSGTSSSDSASFSFSSEPKASFECKLDSSGWAGCTNPSTYGDLVDGKHTFQVRAEDVAGNTDSTPASRSWTVATPEQPAPEEPSTPPVPSGDADLFLATAGSDSAACSASAPCKTLNRAYQVAAAGDIVELAAGSYGSQTIQRDTGLSSSEDVVFRPADGAGVTLGSVTVYGSHVTIEGMQATDLTARVTDPYQFAVTDITFRNMDARNFMVMSATNVNVIGGDYGPASDCGGPYGGSNNSIRRFAEDGAPNPSNILVEGVRIHDIVSENFTECHIEGLAIFAGNGVTVRDSKFWGNSVYDIFLQSNSGPVSNVLIENNWFAAPVGEGGSGSGASTLAFSGGSGDFANSTVRHNSMNGYVSFDDNGVNPAYANFKAVGNIGQPTFGSCSLRGVIYRYNLWKGMACGTGDVNLSGAYPYVSAVNGAGMNYHLAGGAARDLVPATESNLATDIDGEARPQGPRLDAGSDESAG
jgi:outer membrane biosynthesis protein TonB